MLSCVNLRNRTEKLLLCFLLQCPEVSMFATLDHCFLNLSPHAVHRKAWLNTCHKYKSFPKVPAGFHSCERGEAIAHKHVYLQKKKKNSQTKIGPLMHCLKIYGASAPHEATCVFICVQKSKKGWWGLRSLPVSTHFCERAMCNGDGHFLSQLIPYPDSAGSCSARCTPCARPPKPLVFMGLFALSLPSLEILFIICGIVWRFWFLFLCWLWQILRERGVERGGWRKHLVLFYGMLGGSVKFSLGFGGPCEWKGNSDDQESFWWESWWHRGDGNYKTGFHKGSHCNRAGDRRMCRVCKGWAMDPLPLRTDCLWLALASATYFLPS